MLNKIKQEREEFYNVGHKQSQRLFLFIYLFIIILVKSPQRFKNVSSIARDCHTTELLPICLDTVGQSTQK